MKLSKKEQKMLDGDEGPVRQKAMELIVRYAKVIGAEALCPVTWADLFCGCHEYLEVVGSGDFDEVFSRMSLCAKIRSLPPADGFDAVQIPGDRGHARKVQAVWAAVRLPNASYSDASQDNRPPP